jgi:hypothetical protein
VRRPCAQYTSNLGQSVVEKTQRNRAVLFPARFTTLWRIEIHIHLKTDADVCTDDGVGFFSGVKYIL